MRYADTRKSPAYAGTLYITTSAILLEPGRRKMVGGQEDMVTDVAPDPLKEREQPVA
jgi:4-hydroxy 2-oxovalerate aldolase